MADTTPEPSPSAEDATADSTPAARKKARSRPATGATSSSRAKKAGGGRAPARTASAPASPAQAEATPAQEQRGPDAAVQATPPPEPATDVPAHHAAPTDAPSSPHGRSVLDGVRDNPMGPLTAGLLVAIAVGLLLSVLVPSDPSVLAMIILGALLSASVGFAVRYLSSERGLRRQVEAFLAAVVGVHLMSITGAVSGDIPLLGTLGVEGPGLNEALTAALATPPASTGALLAGLTAAIIVGWARRGHRGSRSER